MTRRNLPSSLIFFHFRILPSNVEGDVGVNANYFSHASNSVISFSLAIRFTDDVVIPRNRDADAPCIPTSASPPDIIFSSPSPPGPAGHPVSLVSAFPLTYNFPYLLPCIISLCPNQQEMLPIPSSSKLSTRSSGTLFKTVNFP